MWVASFIVASALPGHAGSVDIDSCDGTGAGVSGYGCSSRHAIISPCLKRASASETGDAPVTTGAVEGTGQFFHLYTSTKRNVC